MAKGSFSIGNSSYVLAKNNNENHLHIGDKDFESVDRKVDNVTLNNIDFSRLSTGIEDDYLDNLNDK